MKLTKLLLIFIFSFIVFTACSNERSSSQVSTTTSAEVARESHRPWQFLYSSSNPVEDSRVTEHVFVLNEDGAERQLTDSDHGTIPDAVWSPNRLRIAFSLNCDSCSESGIYVMNADGTELRQIYGKESLHLSWSPDGQQILFSGFVGRYGVWEQIFIVNVDGTGLRQLHPYDTFNLRSAWSPDGTRVSFQSFSDKSGDVGIYVVNADGTNVNKILNFSSIFNFDRAGPHIWSPDGQKIAFVAYEDDALSVFEDDLSHIFVMNADGSELIQLTDSRRGYTDLAWSPDGQQFAFVADEDGWPNIFVMNADGSDVHKVISKAHTPRWSSTGEYISFYDFVDPMYFNSVGDAIRLGGGISIALPDGTLVHSTGKYVDSFDWNG